MHELVVSPFLGDYLLVRPGRRNGAKLPYARYKELLHADSDAACPDWLIDAARDAWGIDLTGRFLGEAAVVRRESALGYGRASYELNLGCNYDCEHCYLGLKKFEGLAWPDRERLLEILRDAGVLWLQMTGGEPMIDRLFLETYEFAWDLGTVPTLLSNGSRLFNPKVLDLLTRKRPHRITLSVYGATPESYDGLVRRKGAFRLFDKGLHAAAEAGLPLALSMIVTNHNKHEVDQMRAIADKLGGIPLDEYVNMTPTIHGGAETLHAQSTEHLRKRKVFTGCNAGHTFFHVDPHGRASICKVGRDPDIPLIDEGVDGLARLGEIADRLLLRRGGCSGCSLSGTCGTCMPLVRLYRKAKAPLENYCQHRKPREEVTTS